MRATSLRRFVTVLALILMAGSLSACCSPWGCGPGPGGWDRGGGHHGGGGGFYGGGGGGRGWR